MKLSDEIKKLPTYYPATSKIDAGVTIERDKVLELVKEWELEQGSDLLYKLLETNASDEPDFTPIIEKHKDRIRAGMKAHEHTKGSTMTFKEIEPEPDYGSQVLDRLYAFVESMTPTEYNRIYAYIMENKSFEERKADDTRTAT